MESDHFSSSRDLPGWLKKTTESGLIIALCAFFCGKIWPTYTKATLQKKIAEDFTNDAYTMFCVCVCVCVFISLFTQMLWYSFELHQQINAIQMGTYNICLYKEVDKNFTGCYLKTTITWLGPIRVMWSNIVIKPILIKLSSIEITLISW